MIKDRFPLLSTDHPIRAAVLLSTIAVLAFAFFKTQTTDFTRHARIQSQLGSMRLLEQAMDRDILKVRIGLVADDAGLVELTERMSHLLVELQLSQDGMNQGPSGIDDQLALYGEVLVRRMALLRQFNSRNEVVVNSLRSFPTLAGVLIDEAAEGNAEVLRAVSSFERAVWRYYIDSSRENATAIGVDHNRLHELAAKSPSEIQSYVRPLLRHAEILLAHRSEADWILKELLSNSGVKRLTAIVSGYRSYVAQQRRASDRYRTVMFVAALVLIGYVALTLVSLIRVRLDLQKANEALENRIEELIAAKEAADFANRSKSDFLAMMSHELRTPLNAVIGFSDIIRTEAFGPMENGDYKNYAEDIHSSGQHLLSLINDILDLSKIESGTLTLDEDTVDVVQTVQTVEILVKERANRNNVSLTIDCPRVLPALNADARKVKQMLANLLSNAIKFTESGGEAYLKVRCDRSSGYLFEVGDSGIGISADDIPKALAPFIQIDSSLSRKHEGTGLGLPLTKRMIELHGGDLTLDSVMGIGTVARLVFPPDRIGDSGKAEILPFETERPPLKLVSGRE